MMTRARLPGFVKSSRSPRTHCKRGSPVAADVISHLNQLVGVRQIETKETAETVEFDQVVQDLPPFLVPALPRSLRHRPVSRVWGFGPQNPGPTYQSVILASLYRRDPRFTVGQSPGPFLLVTHFVGLLLDGLRLLLCRATPPPPPLRGSLADGLWILLCRAPGRAHPGVHRMHPHPDVHGFILEVLWKRKSDVHRLILSVVLCRLVASLTVLHAALRVRQGATREHGGQPRGPGQRVNTIDEPHVLRRGSRWLSSMTARHPRTYRGAAAPLRGASRLEPKVATDSRPAGPPQGRFY